MKRLITLLLAVLVLAAIYASVDPRQLVAVFVRSDVRWLAASFAMFLPTMLCTAWRLKVLTPPPARIDLAEATRLTAVAASLNVILPSKMGDIVKGIFIAGRGHLGRALALNLTMFEKACDLLALLAWCVLGLVMIGERGPFIWSMGFIVGGALAFGTVALTTPLLDGLLRRAAPTLPVVRRHKGELQRFADAWAQMRRANSSRPCRALAVAAMSLGIWLLHLIQIWMFSEALGGGVPLVDSLALTPLAILVGLLPLTPAGIGTRDAALIYFYRGYFDAATGAALGLLCTLRYVVPAVAGLPWLRAGWAMQRPGPPHSSRATFMQTRAQTDTAPRSSLRRACATVAIVAVVLGVSFRFANLGGKVFWVDEVIHTHYTFGFGEKEIHQLVKGWFGKPISPWEFLVFQRPDPARGAAKVVATLAQEEPQSPPLHYLLLRHWVSLMGDSVATRRALSAVMGALAIACLYWVCRELFGAGTLQPWIAASLAAVAPVFVLYAQETRPYSLWAALTLLATALMLRAARRAHWGDWAAYTAVVVVGFYTHPFTGPVVLGHGAYLFAVNGFRFRRTLFQYAVATAVAVTLFLPWATFIIGGSYQMSDWRETTIPLRSLMGAWVTCVRLLFVDLNPTATWFDNYILGLATCALAAACVLATVIRAPRKVGALVLILIAVIWLPLMAQDLYSGGLRSTVPRYLVPTYLGILIAVSYALGRGLAPSASGAVRRWGSVAVWVALLGLGVASCARIAGARIWWVKLNNVDNPAISRIINDAPRPLLIAMLTDDGGRSVVSLAYDLAPHVRLMLMYDETTVPDLPAGYSDVYVYSGTHTMRQRIEAKSGQAPEQVYKGFRTLWRLRR